MVYTNTNLSAHNNAVTALNDTPVFLRSKE